MENELEIGSEKIRVGITHGDINGIGYEIIIKALSDPRMLELFTPVVYGSSKVASYHRKTIDAGEFNFNVVKSGEPLSDRKANIINVYNQEIKIELGQCTPIAGELAYLALENAIDDLKHDRFDVLVTAPINKKKYQKRKVRLPGPYRIPCPEVWCSRPIDAYGEPQYPYWSYHRAHAYQRCFKKHQ